jgi:hypothetical protein
MRSVAQRIFSLVAAEKAKRRGEIILHDESCRAWELKKKD